MMTAISASLGARQRAGPPRNVSTSHGGVTTTFQSCQSLAIGAASSATRLSSGECRLKSTARYSARSGWSSATCNVVPGGRPLAVFIESDDTGFKYHAGYPLEAVPDGKSSLSEAVKIGQTPSGKAMRFEHQGAYADIDATYDAITAYLDE